MIAADLSLLVAPLAAGLLVVATHVPLGQQVLERGIVFIDLAIAQVAGLGVIVAGMAGAEGLGAQFGAMGAALGAALLLTATERRWPEIQEALIGTLFVLAASAGIVLLAGQPQGGEQLRDLLAGQILWVTPAQLAPTAGVSALVLGLWVGFGRRLGRFGFYGVFALAVTASVQLVGVYLVFATLIIPALATRALTGPPRILAGVAIGAAGYGLGLAGSVRFDLPGGALIVLALAAAGGLFASLVPPRRPLANSQAAVHSHP